MNEKTNDKVTWVKSLNFVIMLSIGLAIIGTAICNYVTVIPSVSSNYKELTKQYVYDVVLTNGDLLKEKVNTAGLSILETDSEKQALSTVHINGEESSYIYVVATDGTMLYHPTESKIGQPVENDVVKNVVSQLQSGQNYDTQVVTYDYQGVTKYAGIYADAESGFILVIAADEADALAYLKVISRRTIMGSLLAYVVFSVLCSLIVLFIIVKPIRILTKYIQKISEMDFTEDSISKILCKRSDETGIMARSIEKLRNELTEVVTNIKQTSNDVFSTAASLHERAGNTANTVEQVERAVQEIADGATSQAEDTQKATENVVLMGNMVEETTQEVKELQYNSESMRDSSNEAQTKLEELQHINQKARESIEEINRQTHTTNESALKIREATNIISSIADETNLLSLNASIEAARAGEQGRGFAVVAAQIQKLAEQSNDSARQIEEIIDLLIADSDQAVETMNRVNEIMNQQNDTVNNTGITFDQVKNGIGKSLQSVELIAQKTAKLDDARVNVVDVVQNLTAIAEENAATTQETSASTTEVSSSIAQVSEDADKLRTIAEDLDNRMNIFKL